MKQCVRAPIAAPPRSIVLPSYSQRHSMSLCPTRHPSRKPERTQPHTACRLALPHSHKSFVDRPRSPSLHFAALENTVPISFWHSLSRTGLYRSARRCQWAIGRNRDQRGCWSVRLRRNNMYLLSGLADNLQCALDRKPGGLVRFARPSHFLRSNLLRKQIAVLTQTTPYWNCTRPDSDLYCMYPTQWS